MGWSHPDISLDELTNLIEGFVDILILASGYQSSGLPATWDSDNIKKAIQWGRFFEDVLKRLRDTVYFEDSVKELDAILLTLTSNTMFPQGLAQMTPSTFSKARYLVLERLLQTHPLKDADVFALLTAIIETDVSELAERYDHAPNIYMDRLMSKMESLNLGPAKDFIKDVATQSFKMGSRKLPSESYTESNGYVFVDHSSFVIQQILKIRASESCLSSIETDINNLLKVATGSILLESERSPSNELQRANIYPEKEEMISEYIVLNTWRSRCLSYLLDKRTIRLLSGANLIFTAPKLQWIRVFEPLRIPTDANNDNILEIMEILLMGFISRRWSHLVEHFISHAYIFLPISMQCSDLRQLLQKHTQSLYSSTESFSSKEKDIVEYLMQLLKRHPHKLWQVHPVLVAAAIPTGSILFRMYLSDIEEQLNEDTTLIRCCDCRQDGQAHKNCELADRIRCLYVFHIQGSNMTVDMV